MVGAYLGLAERSWRWVLDQVRWDDGPWIPGSVTEPAETVAAEPPWDRDGMHSGVGGLAHVLAEIRLGRDWTEEESALAGAIATRVRAAVDQQSDYTFFDGLVSAIGVLTALSAAGVDAAVARLRALATSDGWLQTMFGPPAYRADTRIHDVTLGTAGILLGALWAGRRHVEGADELSEQAAALLLTAGTAVPNGMDWRMVSAGSHLEATDRQMPNFSHGLAGIATTLALAGAELARPDLVTAAVLGAHHLVELGDSGGAGFVVPRGIPTPPGFDDITHNWCHGGAGTSLLFVALHHAGVDVVAGHRTLDWHRRCLHSVRTSGVPDRLRPGFWDNDGRCCGTAGVAEAFLDSWQRFGEDDDLDFALSLADTLVERAVTDGPHAYWRFVEHRAVEPLLPPGVGWMQGAAGISALLFRAARIAQDPTTTVAAPRMENWWALPA